MLESVVLSLFLAGHDAESALAAVSYTHLVAGGSVIEITQLFVRTDSAPFRFDVDAIILRVAGAVVFWWIGRIPAVKKLLGRLF